MTADLSSTVSTGMRIDNQKTAADNAPAPAPVRIFQLPGLPQSISESLAKGTSIPPPPPSPPLSERNNTDLATTDDGTTKPSAIQAISFPSPPLTHSMPGAFPPSRTPSPTIVSPRTPRNDSQGSNSYTASAYASDASPRSLNSPNSKSPRRPSGLRNLLSFRRFSHLSPSPDARRESDDASSLASTFETNQNRDFSGGIWRGKSAIRTQADERMRNESASSIQPNEHSLNVGTDQETGRTVAVPAKDFVSMTRKSSGRFWRRKSAALSGSDGSDGYFAQKTNGNRTRSGDETPAASPRIAELMTPVGSPPPKLPELSVVNEHLDAENMFKDIR